MKNSLLHSSIEKILNWNRQNYHELVQCMTAQEISAMRQELINNCYPVDVYKSSQADYNEQIVYHYILFMLYEYEYSDSMNAETRQLYDILYYL